MVQIVFGGIPHGFPMLVSQAETLLRDEGWTDDSVNSSGSWKKKVVGQTLYLRLETLHEQKSIDELP